MSLRAGVEVRGCTNPNPDTVGSLGAVGPMGKGLKDTLGDVGGVELRPLLDRVELGPRGDLWWRSTSQPISGRTST